VQIRVTMMIKNSDAISKIHVKLPPWPPEAEYWDWKTREEWLQKAIEDVLDQHVPDWRERRFYLADFHLEGVKTWDYLGE
jgi:hypothetical protein